MPAAFVSPATPRARSRSLSGAAGLSVYCDPRTGEYRTQKFAAPRGLKFPGTTVMVALSTDATFDLAEALELDGSAPALDLVDLRYTSEGGDLLVRICEESLALELGTPALNPGASA